MKHSHENSGGRGAKIILPLFKSLLIDLKHRCLGFTSAELDEQQQQQLDPEQARAQQMIEQSKQVLEQLDDESLLPYFMQGLASGSSGTCLPSLALTALRRLLTAHATQRTRRVLVDRSDGGGHRSRARRHHQAR